MVNPEKHKTATSESDDVKPIKSTISTDFDDGNDGKYFAHAYVYNHEIKSYVADNFKKEITDLDVLNFALFLCNEIVTAKKWKIEKELIKTLTEIINDDSKLNEYIFTNLAGIKAWNETVFEIESKYGSKDKAKEVSEKEFDDILKKYNEKNQYKAWNDERQILDIYSNKSNAAKGDSNGGNN